ncbi:uncharacterized protein LOC126679045 isoform X2 [Mercurialis annua]|uniref:uncharacterized protein LOC126679045 isoform X2 n=1 Tax=Mercurialis annua TaxID=3986 RepID=UPI00215DF14E|nr:uncharacterized protein LOC126679045 isoform X2 [Mercurialis annua]
MKKILLSSAWSLRDLGFSYWAIDKQMQEVAGERGGYLHGRGALDSDDLLYLKEQMEAEEDAERLLRRTEKRAFAAFKKAASLADSSPASVPLPLRVEPKPKSGIRQQDLLKKVVEVKPKRPKVLDNSGASHSMPTSIDHSSSHSNSVAHLKNPTVSKAGEANQDKVVINETGQLNPVNSLLGLAYANSDDEDDDDD